MSFTPFERPIVLDLSRSRPAWLEALLWSVGAIHVVWAAVAVTLKIALLAWAVVWLVVRLRRDRDGSPRAARWHPGGGWQLCSPQTGWQHVELDGAHLLATDLLLLCWRHSDGRRWCRLVRPGAAPDAVRRRLRVLLRFGLLHDDG